MASGRSFACPLIWLPVCRADLRISAVGAGGLEPPQPCGLRILSPLRLPVSPCPRSDHPRFNRSHPHPALELPAALTSLSSETLLVLAAYTALAGAYLVAVPLALYAWMVRRWTTMGKVERTAVYGLVFLFFPGLILFAPFINLRMAGQGEV